tara:strand:- start:106 stop:360 length:255 start_codon:yes stop_codon:yes gene_type:complete
MINDLIYWVGVVTIIVVLLGFGSGLVISLTKFMSKELGRAYGHAQLYYFMSRLKRNGLKDLLKDIDKFAAIEKTREERAKNADH